MAESEDSQSRLSSETDRLLREYTRSRDRALRDRIVALNRRLVRYCAARYSSNSGTCIEDLTQVGYIGLLNAIERYDPTRGISFVSFATPTILGEIKRYLRDHTWGLKAPRRLRELGLSLRKLRARLETELGRSPTAPEMAKAAGVNVDKLLEAMELDALYQPLSLDSPVGDSGGYDEPLFSESVGRLDPAILAVEEQEVLRRALARLNDRQRAIIHYRFFEERTQVEIAQQLGISQMHVSRLERQALQYLRSLLRNG